MSTYESTAGPATPVIAGCTKVKGPVFLKVATVLVDGPAGPHLAFWDTGSQVTLVTNRAVQAMGLQAKDGRGIARIILSSTNYQLRTRHFVDVGLGEAIYTKRYCHLVAKFTHC